MSGLFGRKGADSAERQQTIKKYLNKELSLNIKKLQRDHISSASAIRSGETVNRICSCLEAIFLHELKDSYSSKTFWPFVTKFTHRDVLEQIKQLLFIRTEIGRCRAWIRMAVNDCLMDSYLSAILREPSTLKQYYKQGAFLRDAELPLITNNYLQGLTVFTFQLSCNSSVLNMWDTALLLLSGAYISKETQSESSGTASLSPTQAPERDRNTSFHESEMSPSLLAEDVKPTSESGVTSSGEYKSIGVGSPVKVEEFEDSIVIHMESEETAGVESSTNVAETNGRESTADLELRRDNGQSTNIFSTNESNDHSAKTEGKGSDFPVESSNPFVPSYSEQNDEQLVYLRRSETTRKAKKKRAKKGGVIAVSPLSQSEGPEQHGGEVENGTETPVLHERMAEEVDARERDSGAGGVSEDMARQGMADVERPRDELRDEEDIYHAGTMSDRKEDNKWNGHGVVKEEGDVEEEVSDPVMGGIVVEEPRGLIEDEEWAGQQTAGDWNIIQSRPETKEESFEGSFGNSLSGMQGWSSDFDRLTVPESSSDQNIVESQESYSTMVGKYMQTTSPGINVPEGLAQSDDKQDVDIKEKETKTSEDPTEIIEDFEVIPITNGPLSKYADDRTQELLDMVTKIGHEKGLAAQKFQCRGCSCELGIIFGKHRVCNYNGYYYCSECHLDEQAVIPARILYNWDFRKHPVACHTKLFLNQVEDMPLIDVGKCNPTLYSAISEMEQILALRKQIVYLKAYLFTCKESVAEELRSKIWPRDYMLENWHLYSVKDFLQVQNGTLGPHLKKIIVFAAKHVQQCALCSQKGFICEICENPKIIYPFDTELTVRCEKCRSVFHKACKTDIKPCPRCLRRKLKSPADQGGGEHTEFPSPFT